MLKDKASSRRRALAVSTPSFRTTGAMGEKEVVNEPFPWPPVKAQIILGKTVPLGGTGGRGEGSGAGTRQGLRDKVRF